MQLKQTSIFTAIAFLVQLAAMGQGNSDSATIVQLLKDDYKTMQNWDTQKHIANCTKDYLLIENGEIWDLQKEIESYKANANRIIKRTDSFNILSLKIFGNVAYDVHHLQSVITENNTSIIKVWNESVVFRKEGGRWKIALIHSSLLSSSNAAASFDHVALYVRNMEKSVAFYKQFFQLDTMPVPAHGNTIVTWFKLGDRLQLHLVEGLKDSMQIPFNHIAFSVSSISDFTDKLKRANIVWFGAKGNFTTDYRADGVHQVYFRDPDGYEIEVNDRKQ
jgi:lactoylglutathione lyase